MTVLFPSAQLHLHLLKFLGWDNRFMVSFHVILLYFAVIDFIEKNVGREPINPPGTSQFTG